MTDQNKTDHFLPLFRGRKLEWRRTLVMGILNVTNDSFYEESRTPDLEAALWAAERMATEGADILDIGAESTRPGSAGMGEEDEALALIPVVEAIRRKMPEMPISVDTRKANVAARAIAAGADIVNDVSGLELAEESAAMTDVLRDSGACYVLMHTKGTPDIMHLAPNYDDFMRELLQFFEEKLDCLERSGIERGRVILDPGIGFGKRLQDNLDILANLRALRRFGLPVLVGASRKGFIGRISGLSNPADRLEGTLAVAAISAYEGAQVVRVHDVRETRRTVDVADAIRRRRG